MAYHFVAFRLGMGLVDYGYIVERSRGSMKAAARWRGWTCLDGVKRESPLSYPMSSLAVP